MGDWGDTIGGLLGLGAAIYVADRVLRPRPLYRRRVVRRRKK